MSKESSIKIVAVTLLLAAAFFSRDLVSPSRPRELEISLIGVLVLFGIFNIFLTVPGTTGLRIVAVASAIGTLLLPKYFAAVTTLLLFIIWPVWLMIAWSAHRDDVASDEKPAVVGRRAGGAALIVSVALASLAYRWLFHHRLEQTAALFVGIPALLGVLVIFLSSPRSAAGVACKAVTIGLLLSMMFLWEGALCVLMSAPLFYTVAIGIGAMVDSARRKRASQTTLSCLMVLILVPMSLEGVTERTSFNRDEWVAESRRVQASPSEIGEAILAPPRFDRPLPLYLRAGFPRATKLRVEQSPAGPRWIITIKGGEMLLNGMEARTGTLELQLEEARPGLMRWRVVSDDSHMTHFLRWREARVEWKPAAGNATEVTWSLRYDRGLDPAWYFGPWERYAARLAAGYLIDAVATP
jgi:hypothetical protein